MFVTFGRAYLESRGHRGGLQGTSSGMDCRILTWFCRSQQLVEAVRFNQNHSDKSLLTNVPRSQVTRKLVPLSAVLLAGSCTEPEPLPTDLSVSPPSVAFAHFGETATFTATISDQYGAAYRGTPIWSGSDPSVFEINANGIATSVGNGQGTVTASFQGLSATASVTVLQVPAELRQAGADQRARAGRALPEPVVVRLLDAGGSPVEGAAVTFTPGEGHGTAEPTAAESDSAGLSRTAWTLGPTAGPQSLVASVAGGPTVRIGATALTPEEAVAVVEQAGGADQRARAGRALPEPVVVRLLDAGGSPVEGATVTFTPGEGHGTAEPAAAESDSAGLVRTAWTLGPTAGPQSLVASVAGGPTVRIGATALTPEETVAAVEQASGADQRARAGRALPEPVVVRLLDAGGSPVEGATVTFTPGEGHGTAEPAAAESDSAGLARTAWTLGPAVGRQSLAASVTGGPSARVEATGLPNRAPEVRGRIPDQSLAEGGRAASLDVSGNFTDPDGDALSYAAASSDGGVASASVSGATVTVRPASRGTATVTVTASDPAGLTASLSFAVTVKLPNRAPEVRGRIPDQSLAEGGRAASLDVSGNFTDPDGDALSYAAASSDGGVASASVSGATVTVRPASRGTATVTVTASDPAGLTASLSFAVTVTGTGPASAVSFSQSSLGPAEAGKRYQGDALLATVTDAAGLPVVGAPYRWVAADSTAGWMFPATGVTDSRGTIATTSWIGGWPGRGTMTLIVGNAGSADLTAELSTTSTSSRNPPNGALAVWMDTNRRVLAQGFSVDMTPLEEPCGTYYAAIQWDGGYTGLQRCGSQHDRQLQFSVWNVPDLGSAGNAEVVQRGEGVACRTFGGEGTGQACELNYPWQVGSTYRFEVTEAEMSGGSAMTLHVTDVATGSRRFVGTLRFARRANLRSFAMFTEDFVMRARHCLARATRSASIRRAMALVNGSWQSLTRGVMSRWETDPHNAGTPGCANVAIRSHQTGLEVVVGGDAADPDGSTVFSVPR